MYKTFSGSVLTYGGEAWMIKKVDEKKLTSSKIKLMWRTIGCAILDHK
jgi:hypothetical protein